MTVFCIEFECQWHQKDAGLITNMLVATGSAIFVLLSVKYSDANPDVDVTRIIAQIVTGIGFLGAGVVFREGASVHGLSSAATIWCGAAIGAMAASERFLEAIVCTGLVLLMNTGIRPLDKWMKNRRKV